MIPKKDVCASFDHFRPISVFHFLKKISVKILVNRLVSILPKIVSLNQTAFIKGRGIVYNILLSHELMRKFNQDSKQPKMCSTKIDIQKAFDSVNRYFLLRAFLEKGDSRSIDRVEAD